MTHAFHKPTPQPQSPGPSGLLVVDKRDRLSSTSVVRVAKARLRHGGAPKRIKVGHGGTLDPLASGVLVILVGKATKLCDAIMAGEKEYVAEVDLARRSPTDDLEAEAVGVPVARVPTRADIDRVLAERFTGVIQQTPPAHSAVMIGGTRAYDLARAGREVPVEPRPVVIHSIRVVSYDWPTVTLDIRCGKGTYIRSLARDLGTALDAGGVLTNLRRTRVGRFTLAGAIDVDDIPEPLLQKHLLVTDEVRALLPDADKDNA